MDMKTGSWKFEGETGGIRSGSPISTIISETDGGQKQPQQQQQQQQQKEKEEEEEARRNNGGIEPGNHHGVTGRFLTMSMSFFFGRVGSEFFWVPFYRVASS